jgi:(E)-4-hydroxy-3-methylbut-2-enyl-diphosphate synthase
MSRQVFCGSIPIGGGAPISIQSMTNTDTRDEAATVGQIRALAAAGCDIVRCAVPDMAAADALGRIITRLRGADEQTSDAPTRRGSIPIVADIHFDYRLAIAAIDAGADKIRINPGNIGGADKVAQVVRRAKSAGVPIRIGVNSGSLEKSILEEYGGPTPAALAASALRNIEAIRAMGLDNLVVSIKSSDVRVTNDALKLLALKTDCPIHVGITEAGMGQRALVKSAVGIGALLLMGVGDTIRVSITGDPLQEIPAARDILASLGLLPGSIEIISCPTCGRCRVDLGRVVKTVTEVVAPLEEARITAARTALFEQAAKQSDAPGTVAVPLEEARITAAQTALFEQAAKQSDAPGTVAVPLEEARITAARTALFEQTAKQSDAPSVPVRPLTLAVMGCAVNGPGEASHADFGVACGDGKGLLFKKGKAFLTVPEQEIAPALLQALSEQGSG